MNLLLQRMLESQGIYRSPVEGEGAGEGMPSGQETDQLDADQIPEIEKPGQKQSDDIEKEKKEKAILLKDVMKWKDKAKSTEQEKETLASQVEKMNKVLGEEMTLEDVEKMISERKELERKELERKGEYDRILEKMREENKKALSAVSNQVSEKDSLIKSLREQLEEMSVGRAFSDSAFIRENSQLPPSIARKEFADYFDTVDGKLVAYDKPRGQAERTPLVDSQGNHKSFEDAIAQLYASHPDSKDLLKSKRKPGGSSKTLETPQGAAPVYRTREEKIQAGLNKLAKS